jgi:hypothetical protein
MTDLAAKILALLQRRPSLSAASIAHMLEPEVNIAVALAGILELQVAGKVETYTNRGSQMWRAKS